MTGYAVRDKIGIYVKQSRCRLGCSLAAAMALWAARSKIIKLITRNGTTTLTTSKRPGA